MLIKRWAYFNKKCCYMNIWYFIIIFQKLYPDNRFNCIILLLEKNILHEKQSQCKKKYYKYKFYK